MVAYNKGDRMNKVRIMGHDVNIEYEAELSRIQGHQGYYDPVKSAIKVDSDMNQQEQTRILIHEIIEVINRTLHLELHHDQQINKLDAAMMQLFADNKELMHKIIDES
jgi:hypothetical protein